MAPASSLSVDFETGALPAGWATLPPQLGDVGIEAGELVLRPPTGGLPNMWFNDGEGLAFVRTIHGDFELGCALRVHAPGDLASPPPTGYRLGGLLVRDPAASAPGAHEWCHVATGSGNASEPSGVEWKETHASVSAWSIDVLPGTHRELRLLRTGATITAWHRELGASAWVLLRSYSFPTLPTTVEVGAMAYSNDGDPQMVARFDYLNVGG